MSNTYDERELINNNFNTITVVKEVIKNGSSHRAEYKIQGEIDIYEKRNEICQKYIDEGYEKLDFGTIDFYFTKKEKKLFTKSEIYVMIILSKEKG